MKDDKVMVDFFANEKKMLDGLTIFLSGPIDRIEDDGVVWRRNFKDMCRDKGLSFKFFDPCDKPKNMGSEIGDEKLRIQNLMAKKKWEQAKAEVKIFGRYDLRMVDLSHCLILYCDINVHMCGSYEEFVTAKRQHKPCFVVMADGYDKYDIPTWLIQHLNENEVFDNLEECVCHLELMNEGKIITDDRWVIV